MMEFALSSAAVNCCQATAQLDEEQTLIGFFAGTQACCQAVLHSSTEHWMIYLALSIAAMLCCQAIAQLYEE